jgi:hypothetical protein
MFPKKHSAALVLLFGLLLHNTVAQQNILIHQPTSGDYAPCEPSIAINPKIRLKLLQEPSSTMFTLLSTAVNLGPPKP